jgi:hypothetical protein
LRAILEASVAQEIGESGLPLTRRPTFAFILLFLTIIFAISSLRSWLRDPVSFDLFQLSRVASVLLGTFFFGSMIVGLSRRPDETLPMQARRILWQAFCAALVVAAVRMMIDSRWPNDLGPTLPQSARWLSVWFGYYLAGCAAFLALRYHHALADQRQRLSDALPAQSLAGQGVEAAGGGPMEALWIERSRQKVRVPIDQMDWLEAEGNYVRIHAGDTAGMMRMTLARAEESLGAHGFIRVHRSVLCRRDAIAAVLRSGTGALRARLVSGDEVPVGRSYRAIVMALTMKPD